MDLKGKKTEGITLIALVITIIILLILAGITIGTLVGENGIITRATKASEEYKIAEAREKLSLVLLDAGVEKRTNVKYNQDAFLDEFIKTNLEGSKIKGDIAIVDGYAFNLDRSAPKIGEYLGKEEDLVFPDLTVNTQISENKDSATITITAQEKKNGISKIEVILDGDVVHTYDSYNNTKEEITETYTTDKNGTYTIKVYGKLPTTETTKVEGLIAPIIYEPNGSEQYAKEFQVKISVDESIEKVKSIKYQWTDSTVEPEQESFTKTIANGGSVTQNELTGRWYLWTLLETESGVMRTGKSEAFYFDNTGPEVTLTSMPISESSFTLKAEATDTDVKTIAKYEFYVNGVLMDTQTTLSEIATYTVTGVSMGTANCYVKVYDSLENSGQSDNCLASTQMHTWEVYNCISTTVCELKGEDISDYKFTIGPWIHVYNEYKFDSSSGRISGVGSTTCRSLFETNAMSVQGRYLIQGSSSMIYFRWQSARKLYEYYNWGVTKYTVSTGNTQYSKGTTKYDDVTATNSTAYPTNGRSGNYWYVYKGLQ